MTVAWGRTFVASVEDGRVLTASSPAARRELEEALAAGPIRVRTEGDLETLYEPGDPGFVKQVLLNLPFSTVEGDD